MTAYYTVPGTSACGVTLYASMIPLSPEERMPSGVVNRFEAGALKGYTAKVSIPDGTWMTSNHRLDPEERKLRMEKTMALSYDMWKDKPALSGNVGVFSSISFPNLNYLGDVDNAECIAGLLEGGRSAGEAAYLVESAFRDWSRKNFDFSQGAFRPVPLSSPWVRTRVRRTSFRT